MISLTIATYYQMVMQLRQIILNTPVTYPLDYKQLLYNGVGGLAICTHDNIILFQLIQHSRLSMYSTTLCVYIQSIQKHL